jgi:hypothetical protein
MEIVTRAYFASSLQAARVLLGDTREEGQRSGQTAKLVQVYILYVSTS